MSFFFLAKLCVVSAKLIIKIQVSATLQYISASRNLIINIIFLLIIIMCHLFLAWFIQKKLIILFQIEAFSSNIET